MGETTEGGEPEARDALDMMLELTGDCIDAARNSMGDPEMFHGFIEMASRGMRTVLEIYQKRLMDAIKEKANESV